MKKIILSLALVLGCLTFANAQQNALGVKFNGGGNSADISFQRTLSDANRLEINLGVNSFDFDIFAASALYQWVFGLDQLAPGFKWYAGAGAGIAFGSDIDFGLSALANIGIEYNFSFPLQLALDYTPKLSITPSFGNFGGYNQHGIRFAARWRF